MTHKGLMTVVDSSKKNDWREKVHKEPFNNYVDKMRRGVGQKMSVFVHAQDIHTT